MVAAPGPIALLGSGETSLAGGRIFEMLASRYSHPVHISVLETPAGFELNSAQVANRVAEFLRVRLQNFSPLVQVVPARRRGGPFSPDDPALLEGLLESDLIFMGPGSPTYAVRQLRGSLAWELVRARHRLGAGLAFASAATIAVGAWVLPVYEIFKVGEEIQCPPGLDLFADFHLPLTCVPHWNNTDGGLEVDTSRCFVGMERFQAWCGLLPPGQTIIGLDEHTGLILDLGSGECTVSGVSSVSLVRECEPEIYPAGRTFPLSQLGPVRLPEPAGNGLEPRAWALAQSAGSRPPAEPPPEEILRLVERRAQARRAGDWSESDRLREQIAVLGWRVTDTDTGPRIVRQS